MYNQKFWFHNVIYLYKALNCINKSHQFSDICVNTRGLIILLFLNNPSIKPS